MLCEKHHSGRRPNSAVVGGTQESRKSAASATAKSILYKIKGSSNAYLPLKSIAEHLWHVLEKSGVWFPSPITNPQPSWSL